MWHVWDNWQQKRRIAADLARVGFNTREFNAIMQTPAMLQQLRQFYTNGGQVVGSVAGFDGANGSPSCIHFYATRANQPSVFATFDTLAHELGHALNCPEQWLPPSEFTDAHDYAYARELGEAHAWYNQYQLAKARLDAPQLSYPLTIENDHDFGVQEVDVFAEIARMEHDGASQDAILQHLAVRNANMFPCGMGDNNNKTYGQCNRWDWMVAHQIAPLQNFVQQLGRQPYANEQKLLVKRHLLQSPQSEEALQQLAATLHPQLPDAPLQQLWQCAQQCTPDALCGVQCELNIATAV